MKNNGVLRPRFLVHFLMVMVGLWAPIKPVSLMLYHLDNEDYRNSPLYSQLADLRLKIITKVDNIIDEVFHDAGIYNSKGKTNRYPHCSVEQFFHVTLLYNNTIPKKLERHGSAFDKAMNKFCGTSINTEVSLKPKIEFLGNAMVIPIKDQKSDLVQLRSSLKTFLSSTHADFNQPDTRMYIPHISLGILPEARLINAANKCGENGANIVDAIRRKVSNMLAHYRFPKTIKLALPSFNRIRAMGRKPHYNVIGNYSIHIGVARSRSKRLSFF